MPERRAAATGGLGSVRLVGRILGAVLDGSDPQPDAIPSADWDEVVRCAAHGKVLPALGAALAASPLHGLPEPAATLLTEAAAANAARNGQLRAELLEILRLLHEAGLRPVLLKGAIRLVDDLYPGPAWRFMGDLDLLLPDAQAAMAACSTLTKAGWSPQAAKNEVVPARHHLRPLRRPGVATAVELHTSLFDDARLEAILPADSLLRAAEPGTLGPYTVLLPTREHQLVHVVAHAQLHHRRHAMGRLDLRGLLETRLLLAARGPDGGRELVHRLRRSGHGTSAEAWLLILQTLMGLPPGLRSARAGVGARLAARRALLQMHHPWVDALGAAAGFYASTAELVLSQATRRGRLLRNLATADFYRRRRVELGRIFGTR